MESGTDYEDALKEAQDLGYCNTDRATTVAAADTEMDDAIYQLCLLAKLAFGQTVASVNEIPTTVLLPSSVDFEYAKLMGDCCTIKLVATAKRLANLGQYDGPLSLNVMPSIVPKSHVLGSIGGGGGSNTNAVCVTSQNMGTAVYAGPGTGRYPTANSIVADVVRVANGRACKRPFPLRCQATAGLGIDCLSFTCPFYIRIPFQDELGIIGTVGDLAEKCGVSIYQILQNPIANRMEADFCITTEETSLARIQEFVEALETQRFCRSRPLALPLLIEI